MPTHAAFSRAATRLTDWTRYVVPGTFTIAWLLTLIVLGLGVTVGRASFLTCVAAWGDGFWELLPFSMQMCLVMFTGSMVAVSPPARRALAWLAARPRTPRASILLVALCSMLLALVHWGISIVGSATLVRELGRRRSGVDYRLLVAAAYLGMGTTWHAGLSASAPLLVATPGHFLESEIGLIPVSATIFSPFNLILVGCVVLLFSVVTPLLHPAPREAVEATPAQLAAIHVFEPPRPPVEAGRPAFATRLEYSRWVNLSFGALALTWLVVYVLKPQHPVTLNALNFTMLGLAIALHPSAASVGKGAEEAGGLVFGIIVQFPLYAGMYGIIRETHLAESLAGVFVAGASARTYPAIVYWYSGIVNYFVPSGGSKWAIEAPYILSAGKTLGVPAAKVVTAYAWGDMMTDIIQPFWAIPLLAAAKLDFREILGFCLILFCIYAPLVSLAFLLFPR
ncbi:MAG TPA: TIGR00366 family protein [Candidatus Eisenbacteria bacterium]|nr:TIGR00366 family protein [Candidatus Eisenbacteria bacterium]